MLKVTVATADPREVDADLLVVPVFKGGIEGPGAAPVLAALGLRTFPVTPEFRGDIGQSLLLAAPGLPFGALLLVGLGRMDETDAEQLRRAAGVAAKAARRVRRVATTLAEVEAGVTSVCAVAEGFLLGAYDDRRFKTDSDDGALLEELTVLTPSSLLEEGRDAVRRAEIYAQTQCIARDLVNLPPDRKRPATLAATIADLVAPHCRVEVRDEAALAEGGFNGILAVGRGSSAPPCLVEVRYEPASPLAHVVLVGKGITFDTGGLNLKKTADMADMKSDMAGAAAIAAACSALAALDVRVRVTALLALAENMPSGSAQRPDDVIKTYSGTTVEVRDTDAEGRLVLADALAYGAELRPDAMIDLATLTGSVIGALGQFAAGVMGNNDELLASLHAAAALSGEALWTLPLWRDLEPLLDTPVADVNNTGDGAGGGAIIGGLFLRRFVDDVPWAHVDLAGPAFLPAHLAGGYHTPGGTGYGVRTLLAWLERRGSASGGASAGWHREHQ